MRLSSVVAWLFVILVGFGTIAPPEHVAVAALIVAAAAVSAAVFLMLELYHPFEGLIRVSSAPLLEAVSGLSKP